jgi:hypothetical protein
VTEFQVVGALMARYSDKPNEYACFPGARNMTGYRGTVRYADFLAVRMWKPHLRVFVEVKCFRSDWLAELRQPEKAESFSSQCHETWLAAPAGVANEDEIPEGWGYYLVTETAGGTALRTVKAARRHESPPIGEPFLLSLLRELGVHTSYPKAWKYAGTEMDERALASVAEKAFNHRLELEVKIRLAHLGVSQEVKDRAELWARLRRALNFWGQDEDLLRQLATKGVGPKVVRHVTSKLDRMAQLIMLIRDDLEEGDGDDGSILCGGEGVSGLAVPGDALGCGSNPGESAGGGPEDPGVPARASANVPVLQDGCPEGSVGLRQPGVPGPESEDTAGDVEEDEPDGGSE